jgi:hypothetical protein
MTRANETRGRISEGTKAMKTATKTKTSPKVAALEFLNACQRQGWTVRADEETRVVTITKHFAPGDNAAFVALDGEYYDLLSRLPARGGSMWGTDGSGVGGYSAILHGCFTMNLSGVSAAAVRTIYGILSRD